MRIQRPESYTLYSHSSIFNKASSVKVVPIERVVRFHGGVSFGCEDLGILVSTSSGHLAGRLFSPKMFIGF